MSITVTSSRRWYAAAAAVGMHGSLGGIYAYSVYSKPLMTALGWRYEQVTLAFSLAIACLGLSAAFLGRRIEAAGPTKSSRFAALLYGGGLCVAGVGVLLKAPLVFYLGYGVLGGLGLGVGYLTPVATLVRWFPERRGFATGLAIMGFGFGALLAGPLAVALIEVTGLAATFFVLGVGYFGVMTVSSFFLVRPPDGWSPAGGAASPTAVDRHEPADATSGGGGFLEVARDRRFVLLWLIFFVHVACGIAAISAASPMAQELAGLTPSQAATMVGLMGLFNGLGRLGWSTYSDKIGRPATFLTFCLLQAVAFVVLPRVSHPWGLQALLFVIVSCYGGGFATLPAYVSDLFGTARMAVIYGYLLTAWSAAGIVGPMLVAYVRGQSGGFATALYLGAAGFVVALSLTAVLRKQRAGRATSRICTAAS